jgi:anti-anti-sigma factor
MAVQQPKADLDTRFAVLATRRNGIDRLSLIGELDRSTVLILESELVSVAHPGGAIVLDLGDLTSIDAWGLRTLERVAQRAGGNRGRLSIVNAHGAVLEAFEEAGVGYLLGGSALSELLDSGDGEWSPVSLPPFLRRRITSRPRVVRE